MGEKEQGAGEAGGALVVQRCRRGKAPARAQKRKGRPDGWTKQRRERFLEVLRATSNVQEAARAVGRAVCTAYDLKKRDPAFAAAWMEALEQGYAELEMCLLRQSLHGTERTETVREGGGRHARVKAVRTVHSYPLPTMVRLWLAHRGSVEAWRSAQPREPADDAAMAREIRARIADIRKKAGKGATRKEGEDG